MGRKVINELEALPEVKAIHVWDPSPDARERVAGCPKVVSHREEGTLWSCPEIRLLFIATPNHEHAALAHRGLETGRAVLCEKPMATTLADSAALVAAAERHGGFLQVGLELRYSLLYRQVKEWIDAGLLGRVVSVQGQYTCCEFRGRGSWRNGRNTGGSMFGEKLCHYIDLPRWWTGDEIEEVHSYCAPNVVPYYEVRDNYLTGYRFRGGAVGHLAFSMFLAESYHGDPLQNPVDLQADDGHELRFIVTGTQGAAETNVFRRRVRRWEFGDAPSGLTSRIAEEKTWDGARDHFYFHNTTDQTADVVKRVLAGREPSISPRDALETMRACEAADISADEGRPVLLGTLEGIAPLLRRHYSSGIL